MITPRKTRRLDALEDWFSCLSMGIMGVHVSFDKVSSIIYKPTHPGCFFFQATLPRGDTEMFLEAMEFPTVK